MATIRKKAKKTTWTNSPPVMMCWPFFTAEGDFLAVSPAPLLACQIRDASAEVHVMLTSCLHEER